MRKYKPEAAELNEALARVLASETFARSERARDLLRYIVEREQEGRADRLKGFSIAVDVFGKDAEFDPSTDAQVRVQAGRLRDLLDQYFETEGAAEALRITVPRGSYVPTYALRQVEQSSERTPVAEPEASLPERHPSKRARSHRRSLADYVVNQLRLILVSIAVVIAMLTFVAYQAFDRSPLSAEAEPGGEQVAGDSTQDELESLPNIYVRIDGDGAAKKVGAVARGALTGFDTVAFIAHEPPDRAKADPLDFVLDVAPGTHEGSVELQLQQLVSGKVISSQMILQADTTEPMLDDRVADFMTATMPTAGTVYAYLESRNLAHGLAKCLLLNDNYYLAQQRDMHKAAYDCFDKLDKDGVNSPLIYSEIAALLLESVTDGYDYPADASREKAFELAQKGVQMAPLSPYAHRAYGFIYSGMGNRTEGAKWSKKAYELGRFDLSMAAAYAYALIMSGNYKDGSPVMSRAVNAASARPTWWDYMLFLSEYSQGKDAEAIAAADGLGAAKRPHYLAARLLAARMKGDNATGDRLLADIQTGHPSFASNPALPSSRPAIRRTWWSGWSQDCATPVWSTEADLGSAEHRCEASR